MRSISSVRIAASLIPSKPKPRNTESSVVIAAPSLMPKPPRAIQSLMLAPSMPSSSWGAPGIVQPSFWSPSSSNDVLPSPVETTMSSMKTPGNCCSPQSLRTVIETSTWRLHTRKGQPRTAASRRKPRWRRSRNRLYRCCCMSPWSRRTSGSGSGMGGGRSPRQPDCSTRPGRPGRWTGHRSCGRSGRAASSSRRCRPGEPRQSCSRSPLPGCSSSRRTASLPWSP